MVMTVTSLFVIRTNCLGYGDENNGKRVKILSLRAKWNIRQQLKVRSWNTSCKESPLRLRVWRTRKVIPTKTRVQIFALAKVQQNEIPLPWMWNFATKIGWQRNFVWLNENSRALQRSSVYWPFYICTYKSYQLVYDYVDPQAVCNLTYLQVCQFTAVDTSPGLIKL